jgi:hypothetical protein
MTAIRIIIGVVLLVGVAGGAITGFGPKLVGDNPHGWLLLAHVSFAPLIIVGLTGVSLLSGRRNRFDVPCERGDVGVLGRVAFWIFLLCGFGNLVTMLSAMFPLFGYIGQDRLVEAHELFGIGLLIAGGIYVILWQSSKSAGRKSHAS